MIEPTFKSYLKLVELSDEQKRAHNIKVGARVPRYDVTKAAGYFPQLKELKNDKEQVYFYLTATRDTGNQSHAERNLQGKNSLNFSSIFIVETSTEGVIYGFGNPNRKETYGKKNLPNPFYKNRNDGYLFIIQPGWYTIEILVIPDGLYTIEGNAKALIDGQYDEALETMRATAKTYFQY